MAKPKANSNRREIKSILHRISCHSGAIHLPRKSYRNTLLRRWPQIEENLNMGAFYEHRKQRLSQTNCFVTSICGQSSDFLCAQTFLQA